MAYQDLGRVSELNRFPVKSLRGESIDSIEITTQGFAGDRLWAFRDEAKGEIASAKHNPALLQVSAALEWDGENPRAKLNLPDGRSIYTTDEDCADHISEHLGKPVSLHGLRPASQSEHYARAPVPPEEFEQYAREFFALKDDEPLPDLSALPPEAMFYTSFPGTYFDVTPLHIILASELEILREELPDIEISTLRFRPNIVIDDLATPATSDELLGTKLQIGAVEINVEMGTPRCAMTTHPQAHLLMASELMRKLVLEWKHSFGVYAEIGKGGKINVGDSVRRIV